MSHPILDFLTNIFYLIMRAIRVIFLQTFLEGKQNENCWLFLNIFFKVFLKERTNICIFCIFLRILIHGLPDLFLDFFRKFLGNIWGIFLLKLSDAQSRIFKNIFHQLMVISFNEYLWRAIEAIIAIIVQVRRIFIFLYFNIIFLILFND